MNGWMVGFVLALLAVFGASLWLDWRDQEREKQRKQRWLDEQEEL